MRLTREMEITVSILVACAGAKGRLVRIGWLESYRGRFSGLMLSKGMERLSIGEIARTFQPAGRERLAGWNGCIGCWKKPNAWSSSISTASPSPIWSAT